MASSAAVLYIRPRFTPDVVSNKSSGALLYFAPRTVSGLYGQSVTASRNDKGKRPSMPPRDVAFLDESGLVAEQWYAWMSYQWSSKIGGVTVTPLPDVEASVTAAQVQAIAAEAVAAGLTQMNIANAQAMLAIKQVTQAASLPGADQIPPIQLTPATTGDGGSSSD